MRQFPRRDLPSGFPLFRIHLARFGPWWFSRSGYGRFDLREPADMGTCYFAEQPEGCFLEVFKDFSAAVPKTEIQIRRLARVELESGLSIADCTSEKARAWGITAEIHSSPDYSKAQDWAAAFTRSGFDGIRYYLRHDPAQHLLGIALFGPAGSPSGFPAAVSVPIGTELLQAVGDRFGIQVTL